METMIIWLPVLVLKVPLTTNYNLFFYNIILTYSQKLMKQSQMELQMV